MKLTPTSRNAIKRGDLYCSTTVQPSNLVYVANAAPLSTNPENDPVYLIEPEEDIQAFVSQNNRIKELESAIRMLGIDLQAAERSNTE